MESIPTPAYLELRCVMFWAPKFSGETLQMACLGEVTCKSLLHENKWRNFEVWPETRKTQ